MKLYMPSISPEKTQTGRFLTSHIAPGSTHPENRAVPRSLQMVVNFTGVDAAMASLGLDAG